MPEVLKGFTLDRRIPVSVMIAVLVQFAVLVAWGSTVSGRVDGHEREIAALKIAESTRGREDRDLAGRLARIEASVAETSRVIARIEAKLERAERAAN